LASRAAAEWDRNFHFSSTNPSRDLIRGWLDMAKILPLFTLSDATCARTLEAAEERTMIVDGGIRVLSRPQIP
jgi:hypothetical protein